MKESGNDTVQLKTAVLFLVFNRPSETRVVFSEIKKQRPERLYIHADAPREENKSDIQKCKDVRDLILEMIDWDCAVKTFFREKNAGCGKGPAEAMDWFFKHEEEGIIIEDDCLPHQDFFGYCTQLLEKFREQENVMYIGASTYEDNYPCSNSYTFTRYGNMAAWATWRRVWKLYSYNLSYFSRDELHRALKRNLYSMFEQKTWLSLYDWILKDSFTTYWDWQFHFTVFVNNGIAIRPCKNLISNIGTGVEATHTSYAESGNFKANRQVHPVLPLIHPAKIEVNKKSDSVHYKRMHRLPLGKRIKIIIAGFIQYKKMKEILLSISKK